MRIVAAAEPDFISGKLVPEVPKATRFDEIRTRAGLDQIGVASTGLMVSVQFNLHAAAFARGSKESGTNPANSVCCTGHVSVS